MPRLVFLCALSGLLAPAAATYADEPFHLGTDGCNHTFQRAGHPEELSHLARPGNTPDYCGYYVGGGCAVRGGGPGPSRGVWGWDYCRGPCGVPHKVQLGWCFGCRPQGGVGYYKTDGPEVPNVFGVKLPKTEHGPEDGANCHGH